ncbi:MAG: methyl-accepting chemotaxis protein [Pseudomonadota bacterium]
MSQLQLARSGSMDPHVGIPNRTEHASFLARQFGKLRSFALEGLLHTAMSSLAKVTDAKTGHSLGQNVDAMRGLIARIDNGVPEEGLENSVFRQILDLEEVDEGTLTDARRLLERLEGIDQGMSSGTYPDVSELDAAFEQFNAFRLRTSGFLRQVEKLERDWMADDVNALALRKHTNKALDELENLASAINMVAINASVEAARAAQHGVGFKVLALEMHRLSERSNHVLRSARKAIAIS